MPSTDRTTSRRRLLATAGAALLAGTAGCLNGVRDRVDRLRAPDEGRIIEVSVANLEPTARDVSLLFIDDDEPVFHERVAVEAGDPDANRAGSAEFEDFPDDPGRYDVYAWYDDQSPEEWAHFDLKAAVERYAGDDDIPCYDLHILVETPPGGDRLRVSIWRAVGC